MAVVAMLKQVAAPVMPPVEGYGIADQQAPHEARKIRIMAAGEFRGRGIPGTPYLIAFPLRAGLAGFQ